MGQPNEASQHSYALLWSAHVMFDGEANTHLLDWGSHTHHRNNKITLACESSSAAPAFGRGMVARTLMYYL